MKNAIVRALTLGLVVSFSTAAFAQEAGADKPAKKEKTTKSEKTEKTTEKTDKKGKKEKKEEKTEKTEKAPAGGW